MNGLGNSKFNEPSWSNSKHDIFTRCRREYFFDKIASQGGWDARKATKNAREAYILKNTRNRYAWSGDLIHVAIEEWLESYKKGSVIARADFLETADKKMRQQYRESIGQQYRQNPKKFTGLVEHDSSLKIPADEWKSVHENVINCLINFFYTDIHKSITVSGLEGVIKPERLDFFMIENLKVYARPDLAVRTKESIKIIDWKTGKINDDNDLQMIYYALYAVKKLKYPIEAINGEIVYLRDNITKPIPLTSEILVNAEEFIVKSHLEMKDFESSVTNTTNADELSGATNCRTCTLCRFQKICSKKVI